MKGFFCTFATRMAKRKIRQSTKRKPLPLKGWLIIGCAVVAIGSVIWWLKGNDENEWTYLSRFGIRLPLRYAVHGIDVSHHNARINWDEVKRARAEEVGVDFVFIKATEGATHIDREFERNWKEAQRVKMKRGAYHFYNPRVYSHLQAANFIRKVKLEKGDMPPVLDLEIEGRKPVDIIVKGVANWLDIVEKHYGVKPIIYTNEHFYKKYIAGNFDDYPLWLAGYSRKHLNDLAENSLVLFWQHSEKGRVKGIRGFVDFNVFIHESEDWEKF
jgi:lysozyme